MTPEAVRALVWLAILAVIVVAVWQAGRGGRRGRRVGAGASGAVYDLLNEDKRKAIEIIVEERAGARDPEHADGSTPDLTPPPEKNG